MRINVKREGIDIPYRNSEESFNERMEDLPIRPIFKENYYCNDNNKFSEDLNRASMESLKLQCQSNARKIDNKRLEYEETIKNLKEVKEKLEILKKDNINLKQICDLLTSGYK